ncbi:MAG: aldo/keto reductase [Sediminibacterium sp.]
MANIILGTVQFGLAYGINNQSGKPSENTVFQILQQAGNLGIDTLDTADAYGNAITLIGKFHKENETRFKVNTKFIGTDYTSIYSELERSLEVLGIASVETLFYHSYKDYAAAPQLIGELQKLKTKGLVNRIGLSVYSNTEFETAINDAGIDVIQLPFNLLDNYRRRKKYLQLAKAKQKQIQVRSVFLQGLFFKNINELPEVLVPLKPYLQKLYSIAEEAKISMESLCLRYVNSHPEIDGLIIGVDNVDQLNSNFVQMTTLPEEFCRMIDEIEVKETELLYPYNWNKA